MLGLNDPDAVTMHTSNLTGLLKLIILAALREW